MKQEIQIRLTQGLLCSFVKSTPEYISLFKSKPPVIDHYAIIDLPSEHSGIPHLKTLFEQCGLVEKGCGYLPQKQNDFLWMADPDFVHTSPTQASPQVVVADFRKSELSAGTRKIVEKYAKYYSPYEPKPIVDALIKHINTRPWPQPTYLEYLSVAEENPLLAWVLLFGRKVNHFGIGIYAMGEYASLQEFNTTIQAKHGIKLNPAGGIIKGNQACGIEQSATLGATILVDFDGKLVEVNDCFLEFVWRHPNTLKPTKMGDYYLDFLPTNADKVIESLYINSHTATQNPG